MSQDQMNRLFDLVLTPAPPDTTDVEAAIRSGRHRRRTRAAVVLSAAAAAVAVVGVTAASSWPAAQLRPVPPAASGPTAQGVGPVTKGVPVTTAGQILGLWHAAQLDGQDVRGSRDGTGRLLTVTFTREGSGFHWGANDVVNDHAGQFEVSPDGTFRAREQTVTAVGPPVDRPLYLANPKAVEQATQARLVPATATTVRTLVLLAPGQVLGVYAEGPPPVPDRTAAGTVIKDFTLYTHCGVRDAHIGKDYYLADPALDDGQSNPPRGWGNPFQKGTMTVYPDGTARFTAQGLQATFVLRKAAEGSLGLCD